MENEYWLNYLESETNNNDNDTYEDDDIETYESDYELLLQIEII